MIKIIFILSLVIFVVSCASTPESRCRDQLGYYVSQTPAFDICVTKEKAKDAGVY